VSEYQYYEFRAIDRPLGQKEMNELRAISTRATITSTSFTNTYQWGDLKADPKRLLRKYFDAFLYVANWGSHWLAFRVPGNALDLSAVEAFEAGESLSVRQQAPYVVLDFCSEQEPGDWEEGEEQLASLISLREDILRGDFRALYLGWLLGVQNGEIDEEAGEPSVPPGLTELSAPLKSLAEFLRLDADLLAAAAGASDPLPRHTPELEPQWRSWISSLSTADKEHLLYRAVQGDSGVRWQMQKRFRRYLDGLQPPLGAEAQPRRTVRDILAARDELEKRRRRQLAEERDRQARERAAARRQHLKALAQREPDVRTEIGALIRTRQSKGYDRAILLLKDLRDAAALQNGSEAFVAYAASIRREHARKPSLLQRLDRADL